MVTTVSNRHQQLLWKHLATNVEVLYNIRECYTLQFSLLFTFIIQSKHFTLNSNEAEVCIFYKYHTSDLSLHTHIHAYIDISSSKMGQGSNTVRKASGGPQLAQECGGVKHGSVKQSPLITPEPYPILTICVRVELWSVCPWAAVTSKQWSFQMTGPGNDSSATATGQVRDGSLPPSNHPHNHLLSLSFCFTCALPPSLSPTQHCVVTPCDRTRRFLTVYSMWFSCYNMSALSIFSQHVDRFDTEVCGVCLRTCWMCLLLLYCETSLYWRLNWAFFAHQSAFNNP